MKKVGLLVFALALIAGLVIANIFSFGQYRGDLFKVSMNFGHGVRGSGSAVTEKRDVSGFTSIETGGVFQVVAVAQQEFGVEISAEDNLMPLITTEVRDGVLRIDSDSRLKPTKPILVRVSAPNLEKLEASGASSIDLTNVKNANLTLSGSGSSKISVSGQTVSVNIDTSGAAKVSADELRSETANVDASGSSKIAVNVSREITSDLSGASSVTYSGTPGNVVTHRSGASSIKQK